MAPMASSDSEVKTCSKTCLKNYESLKKQYDDLLAKQLQTKFELATYKRGLDTIEAQLVTYMKNEVLFSEEVVVLKRDVEFKQYEINKLKAEFEKLKQEKDAIDFKIEKFDKALKDLDQLLGSQITDKSKKGFGYCVVPPPHPLIYNRPNKLDLSYSEWVSDNEDEIESPVVVEKKNDVPTIPKVDVVRPKQQEKSIRKTVRWMHQAQGRKIAAKKKMRIQRSVQLRQKDKEGKRRRNKQEELFTHKEEMAPMALSDSKVNNDKSCSKTCLTNYEALKKQYDDLLVKLSDTGFKAATYKRGLATLEDQIVKYREHEVLFSEEIALLKRSVGRKEYQMGLHRAEFEKVKQEKEGFEFKIAKFDKSAKDLEQLLGSQITDNSKKGLGYSAVPPPHPLIYNRLNKLDLSYSGLDEFKEPEFKGYGPENIKKESNVVYDNSSNETKKNSDAPLIEE
ncbi:hypothetical protein Tco_1430693 [Tanacetum coccineum]